MPDRVTVSANDFNVNDAVTDRACVIDTTHEPVPEHAPDQPANVDDTSAVAVNVTDAPDTNEALHVEPQLIPAGSDDTDPDPVPDRATVNVRKGVKVAVTDLACVIDTTHEPAPEHPDPDQPVNNDPATGVALSVTDVPWPNEKLHDDPQLIPAGTDDTDPDPVPVFDTDRLYVFNVNVAVTDLAWVIDTTHEPIPEQPLPDQPANIEDESAVAVNVTDVPDVNDAAQITPQLKPAGLDDTDPTPVPTFVTVSL